MEILPSHLPALLWSLSSISLLVPAAEGLMRATVTSHQPPGVPSPTLLSRQQWHVHILGRMQEQGGSGLGMAGRRVLCRGFEGALDRAADPRAVLRAEEHIDGALGASHRHLERLREGQE